MLDDMELHGNCDFTIDGVLVKEEDISLDELRQLIQEVEKADRKG